MTHKWFSDTYLTENLPDYLSTEYVVFLFPSFSDPLELHVVIETQVSKRHFTVTHDVKQ